MEMSIYITNLNAYNEGAWLKLPLSPPEEFEDEFADWLEVNIGTDCKIAVHDYDCEVNVAEEFGEYPDFEVLNELATRFVMLESYDEDLFKALMEYGCGLRVALDAIDEGNISLLSDVCDDSDYGSYIVEEGLMGDIPENLQYYIDYEKLGRDWRLEGHIYFTKYGCLCGLDNL